MRRVETTVRRIAVVAVLSLAAWPLTTASAQDAAIMKEVAQYNRDASMLMARGQQAFDAGDLSEACARFGDAVGRWGLTGARFEDFVLTNPNGPKDRQAATRKDFADRKLDAQARTREACGQRAAEATAFDTRVQPNLDALTADLAKASGIEARGDAALAKGQSLDALAIYLSGFKGLVAEFHPRLEPIQQEILAKGSIQQKTRLADIMQKGIDAGNSVGGKMSRICRSGAAGLEAPSYVTICKAVLQGFPKD